MASLVALGNYFDYVYEMMTPDFLEELQRRASQSSEANRKTVNEFCTNAITLRNAVRLSSVIALAILSFANYPRNPASADLKLTAKCMGVGFMCVAIFEFGRVIYLSKQLPQIQALLPRRV